MKKLYTLLFIAIIFTSCDDSQGEQNRQEQLKIRKTATTVNGYVFSIIEFDSCQYIISGTGYSQMMTHKGNCKYCLNRK